MLKSISDATVTEPFTLGSTTKVLLVTPAISDMKTLISASRKFIFADANDKDAQASARSNIPLVKIIF